MSVLTETEARQRVEKLLQPVGLDAFFADYFGRKPLHLKGNAEFGRWLMTSAQLSGLLNMANIWDQRSLQLNLDRERIAAEDYCLLMPALGGAEVLRPSAQRVANWLGRGASLICNEIDRLTPPLNETADALEQVFGARVQANLYYSRKQRQAFAPHYDTHHVLAVHCEGHKTWNIYSERTENPVPHELFWRMSNEEHERAKGDLLFQAEMQPGDILYLPRGHYHDALADSDASLHVTFGLTRPTGLDWFGLAYELALRDPAFRADLPGVEQSADDDALIRGLQELARRLSETASEPDSCERLAKALKGFVLPRERFAFADSKPESRAGTGDWSISFT